MKGILNKTKDKLRSIKGFTLIELLGVIVIIGLILIVVFPTLSKMIHNNNNQEYSTYYDLVLEASETYAHNLSDDLGSSKYTGCARITLSTLINEGYVTEYDDSDVTILTGANDITIRNNNGSISVNFYMKFTKDGSSVEFGTDDSDACESYTMSEETNIKTQLESAISSSDKETVGNDVYITGSSPNNYIWYSGKLWRVVSYNQSTETVKAVTIDSLTSIYYNYTKSSNFSGSDVETWLNNDFLNSLKDSSNFIINANWNSTANTSFSNNASDSSKTKKAKVGLITTYEYGKIKNWYNSDNTSSSWLLSEGTGGNSLYSAGGEVKSASSTSIYSVRPTVTFSSDVLVHGGTGTKTDPYIIDNSDNATGAVDDLINTRYSGEYVKIDGKTYRIVSTSEDSTKIISTFIVTKDDTSSYMYSDNHYDYASSSLRTYLESWASSTLLSYLTNGDYCLDTINSSNLAYRSSKCLTSSRVNNSIKIGLPKIGDLFTSNISGISATYWTLNPNSEDPNEDGNAYDAMMNVVTSGGTISADTITKSYAVVVVMYLDSSVKIASGTGTSSDPYVLTK